MKSISEEPPGLETALSERIRADGAVHRVHRVEWGTCFPSPLFSWWKVLSLDAGR